VSGACALYLLLACGSTDTAGEVDCERVERLVGELGAGSPDAWSRLALESPEDADDIGLLIEALNLPSAGVPAADSLELAELLLAAQSGPLDRVRDHLRTECDVEIENPFATR
jgi:hypothetical protein